METIKEIVVVEGKHDVATLKQYFNVECIVTNGSHCGKKVLDMIGQYVNDPGVIVFTDPDGVGEKIRKKIMDVYPTVKHAFVPKSKAHTTKKVGIEHAEYDALKHALNNVATYTVEQTTNLTMADLSELGLTGQANSQQLRQLIASCYPVGEVNSKTLLKRLNYLKVSKEQIRNIIDGKDSNI